MPAETDAGGIARLVNTALKVERFFIDRDRIDPGTVVEMMQAGKYLLAEDSGALVACVYVELRGERAYFGLLAVDPERQGEGLGRRMIEVAEAYARNAGCSWMDLRIVNLRTELPAFYERLGYVESGTAPFAANEQPSQPCHFVNMSKALGACHEYGREFKVR